jgi:uncharacterized protein (TIGR02453 family)
MTLENDFKGFPLECIDLYNQLRANNSKSWFEEHKTDFEKYVMEPARLFVKEMGQELRKISPAIVADTRYSRSIFRPFRDTRFSKDKSPYKNHLGIFFWEGSLAKIDCPGYYFHLEPPNLMLGVGNHCFSKEILELYRDCVVDPKLGPDLRKALAEVHARGDYEMGVKKFKKTPRGYDKDHMNADLLLFSGLTASCEVVIPQEFYSKEIINYCFTRFEDMAPIHRWLIAMLKKLKK